jgi:hypothetical protein
MYWYIILARPAGATIELSPLWTFVPIVVEAFRRFDGEGSAPFVF